MIKKCCAFLSALMIVLFSTFSHYAAIPTYAAMDPRYYVAAGPLIASMFTAYGYKRSGTNAALANLVAEAVVDAVDAGYTVVRNGVESIAIGIQNGTSYVSNAFNEWLYNWCNAKGMSTPDVDSTIQYPSSGAVGDKVIFHPYTGSWDTFAASNGFPSDVVDLLKSRLNLDSYNVFGVTIRDNNQPSSTGNTYTEIEYNINATNLVDGRQYTLSNFSWNDYNFLTLGGSTISSAGGCVWFRKDNGEIRFSSAHSATPRLYGSPVSYYKSSLDANLYYATTIGASVGVGDAGYTVSADAPAANKTFTEYMSNPASWSGLSWGGQVANVPIDNVDTQAVPITIPIDIIINGQQIGAAVADIISGAQAAIDAALAMTQEVAREGAITQAAQGELEEANTAVDNTIEVADAQTIVSDIVGWGVDYVKPHLANVFQKFPFSIPYDFYLLLKSMYGSGGNTRKLRAVKISNAQEDIFNLDPSSIPVVVDFDYVLPDQIGESDPAAPKFIYDLTVNAFGRPYHAEGTLDLAPFGGYFKLLKMGLAIIWIMDLLLFTQQQISNMKGGQ